MRKRNRENLDKAVELLTGLYFRKENIMVTGSVAMDMLGVMSRDADDIDFIIRMDEQTWRCMRLLEAINNDGAGKDYPDTDNLVFILGDLKINIWHGDEMKESYIKDEKTGIYVSPLKRIIDTKKRYSRMKDLKDINTICKNLL